MVTGDDRQHSDGRSRRGARKISFLGGYEGLAVYEVGGGAKSRCLWERSLWTCAKGW